MESTVKVSEESKDQLAIQKMRIDWEQMFFQALTFIYATKSIEAFEQHLMLTQGHNFLNDIKHYIKTKK